MSKKNGGGKGGHGGGVTVIETRGDVSVERPRQDVPLAPCYFVEARIRNPDAPWLGAHLVFQGGQHKHLTLKSAQREIDARMRHPRIVMGNYELRVRPGVE